MRLLRHLTRHKTFIGNFAAMMSGKSVAAAIALVTVPIIARLFSPGDFGVAAVFLSITGIVSIVASLRYEMALVLPKKDCEAKVIFVLAYRVLFAVCLAMLVVLALYDLAGLKWSALEMLGHWMWLLPLGVLLTSGLAIQENWLARQASFKLVAASQILGSIVNSGTRISFGVVGGTSVFGLIFGNLLGMFGRLATQKWASTDGMKGVFGHFDLAELRKIGRCYEDFPKLNAPAALVFSLGQNLPVLLFGIMFSPAVAGYYAMANRLSQVPVVIIAESLRRVFLQKASSINNRGESLHKAFFLTTVALALLGIVPFGCLWLFGQPVLEWLLGERWFEAGHYLEIMAPWLLMMWVTAPSYPVFIVLRKQRAWLVLQSGLTILRLGAFGLAYLLSAGPVWALQAFVFAMVAGSLITILVASIFISGHAERVQK